MKSEPFGLLLGFSYTSALNRDVSVRTHNSVEGSINSKTGTIYRKSFVYNICLLSILSDSVSDGATNSLFLRTERA